MATVTRHPPPTKALGESATRPFLGTACHAPASSRRRRSAPVPHRAAGRDHGAHGAGRSARRAAQRAAAVRGQRGGAHAALALERGPGLLHSGLPGGAWPARGRRRLQEAAGGAGARLERAARPRPRGRRRRRQGRALPAPRPAGTVRDRGGVAGPVALSRGSPEPARDRPAALARQELGVPAAAGGRGARRGGADRCAARAPLHERGGSPGAVATSQPGACRPGGGAQRPDLPADGADGRGAAGLHRRAGARSGAGEVAALAAAPGGATPCAARPLGGGVAHGGRRHPRPRRRPARGPPARAAAGGARCAPRRALRPRPHLTRSRPRSPRPHHRPRHRRRRPCPGPPARTCCTRW